MSNKPTLFSQTLHFDLSFTADPTVSFQLKAFKDNVTLKAHDNASRQAAIDKLPALKLIPSGNLTHYATVQLPQDWVHMIRVYGPPVSLRGVGTDSGSTYKIPTMVLKAIYAQPSDKQYTKEYQKNKLTDFYSVDDFQEISDSDIEKDLSNFYGPYDLAAALVYHHPEMMNLNAQHALTIHDVISTESNLYEISTYISYQQAETPTTWNVPVIEKDNDGNTLKFPNSKKPVFTYKLSDWAYSYLQDAVRGGLRTTKNHPDLKGVCWHTWPGVHKVEVLPTDHVKPTGEGKAGAQLISKLVNESPIHGLKMEVLNATTSQLEVKLVNNFVRYLSFYVRYIGADNKPVDLGGEQLKGFLDLFINKDFSGLTEDLKSWLSGTTTNQYVGMVSNEDVFMGVPLHAQNEQFTIPFPTTVNGEQVPIRGVELLCGGLGQASGISAEDRGTAWLGLGYTAFFDYALPTYSLISTAGSSGTKIFESLYSEKFLLIKIAFKIYGIISDIISKSPNLLNDISSALISLSDSLIREVLMDPRVWAKLAAYIGGEEAEEAIPTVGDVMKVALCAASAAQLVETTSEVIISPMVMKGKITYSMAIEVTLTPVSEKSFPASSNKCQITFTYSDGTSHVTTIPLTVDTPVPHSVTTYELPVGGRVKVQVIIQTLTGDAVGQGASAWVDNVPDGSSNSLSIAININEKLAKLDKNTTYSHHNKLTYQKNAYQWNIDNQQPAATAENLQRTKVEGLYKISLNQDWGSLGYSWNVQQNFYLQNVGLPPFPNANLQVSNDSAAGKILPAYLRSVRNIDTSGNPAPPDPQDNHTSFLLDPNFTELPIPGHSADGAKEKFYHLRKVELVYNTQQKDANKPPVIQFDSTQSWGCFISTPPDDIAVHFNGYVIGVSEEYSQLFLLKLLGQPTSNVRALRAMPCSGRGTRPGLVTNPVKVAISPDGRVLVLEKGDPENGIYPQIQSFDVHLNPLKSFYTDGGDGQNTFKLDMPTGTPLKEVTFLSLSVEVTGYIYVLWYKGEGYLKEDFYLDVYEPGGLPLTSINGVNAAAMVVGLWRNIFTLNYESQQGYEGRWEPTISEWIPEEETQS